MFQGFSEQTADFLWQIRLNNERSWFLAHKQEYIDHVQTPLRELGSTVYDRFSAAHENRELRLHVTRIYRDARRLFGRGPYKDTLWFSIQDAQIDWDGFPALWFELSPEGYGYGLGLYSDSRMLMDTFRACIDRSPKEMLTLARKFERQSEYELRGEQYKRPKGNPGKPLEQWYNRKYLELIHRGTDTAHYSPDFADALFEAYERLVPYYNYFYKVSDSMFKDRRETDK